jgi:hypothetical protein
MKRRPEAAAFLLLLLCLGLSLAARAPSVAQEESGRSPTSKPTKPEGQGDDRTKTATPVPRISVDVKVSAEGMSALPPGSTVGLKGDDQACGDLSRLEQRLEPDKTTFLDLPVCRVKFRVFITGFNVQSASVDLARYKDPMKIVIKRNGPPVVTFGSAD